MNRFQTERPSMSPRLSMVSARRAASWAVFSLCSRIMDWRCRRLIELQVENFRSFRKRQTLSMVAAQFPEHLDTNTLDPNLKGFGRFLRSTVIYGPNASGKTNLLRAVQFVRNLVVSSASKSPADYCSCDPFKLSRSTRNLPSEFQITFMQDDTRYEYGFSLGANRIEKEWLVEYAHQRGRTLFDRSYNKKGEKYDWKFSTHLKGQRATWSDSTRPNALFLSTAIQLNSTQLLPVFEWFEKRLVVVVPPVTLNESLTLQLLDRPDGKNRLLPFLREADLGVADVTVEREALPAGSRMINVVNKNIILEHKKGEQFPSLITVTLSHATDNPGEEIAFDLEDESHGTQTFFKTAGAWLNVMENGEVLLVDEIEASLHPLLVRFLIERFHSTTNNPKNAQLICCTHDTSLLDRDLFRRDQIWFTEKDRSGESTLYPMTDFHPRNDESFEKAYIRGRYGALPVLHTNGE